MNFHYFHTGSVANTFLISGYRSGPPGTPFVQFSGGVDILLPDSSPLWAPNEPTNSASENVLAIVYGNGAAKLADVPADSSYSYICQIDLLI